MFVGDLEVASIIGTDRFSMGLNNTIAKGELYNTKSKM